MLKGLAIMGFWLSLKKKSLGQGLPEYGVLVGLITLAGITALLALQGASITTLDEVTTNITNSF